MKVLTSVLALLLAWLAVASGYYLADAPHFWGGIRSTLFPLTTCFLPESELFLLVVAVAFLGVPAVLLLAGLAAWGRRQRRAGRGMGDHQQDLWLAS